MPGRICRVLGMQNRCGMLAKGACVARFSDCLLHLAARLALHHSTSTQPRLVVMSFCCCCSMAIVNGGGGLVGGDVWACACAWRGVAFGPLFRSAGGTQRGLATSACTADEPAMWVHACMARGSSDEGGHTGGACVIGAARTPPQLINRIQPSILGHTASPQPPTTTHNLPSTAWLRPFQT